MQYILMLYARESGWSELTQAQQEQAMGAYNAYTEALKNGDLSPTIRQNGQRRAPGRVPGFIYRQKNCAA